MNDAYTEAIKEAFATAQSNVAIIDTIEVYHPSLLPEQTLYLVKDIVNREMTLENDEVKTFVACGFAINLPEKSSEGLQDLLITIDNTDRAASDFIQAALEMPNEPIQIIYRPYLSNDFSAPQLDPPLVLYLSEVSINRFDVSGRASFADVINKQFLTERYTADRFPAL